LVTDAMLNCLHAKPETPASEDDPVLQALMTE
jgi:hypothetical protein